MKENCHNSRTSDDIDIKFGAITKIGKENKTTSKKSGNDVMLANYDVIVTFLIYDEFGAIRKPNSGRIIC